MHHLLSDTTTTCSIPHSAVPLNLETTFVVFLIRLPRHFLHSDAFNDNEMWLKGMRSEVRNNSRKGGRVSN